MRTINSSNLTAAKSTDPIIVDMVKLTYSSTEITRLCTWNHDITVVGDGTYLASGQLLGFGDISDDDAIKNTSLNVTMSGVKSTFTSLMLQDDIEGSKIEIFRGFYDVTTGNLVAAPEPRWAGRVNKAAIRDDYSYNDGDAIVISVECKSLFEVLFKRTSGRNTSPAGFQKHLPTDKSMEFTPSLKNREFSFGKEDE